ncbi:MAG: hypothetical protein AAGI48_13610 [Verrucomicrobiota bacterium]
MKVLAVANDPDFKRLADGLNFVDAVMSCAEKGEAITAEQAARAREIKVGDWKTSFSDLVSKDDVLVSDSEHMRLVPEGSLLGFIQVDNPDPADPGQVGKEEGIRHLLHLMISTGNGFAAGKENKSRIGLGGDTEGWEEINLAGSERWIPEKNRRNKYDTFSAMLLGGKVGRLVRVRHRPPSPAGQSGDDDASQLTWGRPRPTPNLEAAIIAACKNVGSVVLQPCKDDDRFMRPCIELEVERAVFQEFFNSPNGMRGHYYTSASRGDVYTKSVLKSVAGALDWSEINIDYSSIEGLEMENLVGRIQTALEGGKIWPREINGWEKHHPWPEASRKNRKRKITIFPENGRWSNSKKKRKENFDRFIEETGLGERAEEKTALANLVKRYVDTDTFPKYGASYFDWDISVNGTNIDIKGAWIRIDGEEGNFTAGDKLFRGSQIKWFGHT